MRPGFCVEGVHSVVLPFNQAELISILFRHVGIAGTVQPPIVSFPQRLLSRWVDDANKAITGGVTAGNGISRAGGIFKSDALAKFGTTVPDSSDDKVHYDSPEEVRPRQFESDLSVAILTVPNCSGLLRARLKAESQPH